MGNILIIAVSCGGMIMGCVLLDYCIAMFSRKVLDPSLGFPKNMRAQLDPVRRSEARWIYLGTCRVAGTVTNALYTASLDDGLALEMRSTLGRNMMETVVVPWKQLRLEATKGPVFGESQYKIHVISKDGNIGNTVEIGLPQKQWLDDVTEMIQR